jgi:hypothetical protein
MGGSPRHRTGRAGRRIGVRRTAIVAAVASALVGACATPTKKAVPVLPYVAPAGAETARLLSRGAVHTGDAYGIIVFDDAANCAGPRIASAGSATRTPKATQIEAGRTTTLDFVVAHPDKTACRVRWSFLPAAGKTYLVAGALTTKGCSARLLDATDPDHMKAETSAQRRNLGGSACSALVAAPAAPAGGDGEHASEAVLRPGATADDLQGLIGQ